MTIIYNNKLINYSLNILLLLIYYLKILNYLKNEIDKKKTILFLF